jgi:hypothetical protein
VYSRPTDRRGGIALLLALLGAIAGVLLVSPGSARAAPFAADQVLVRFKPGTPPAARARAQSASRTRVRATLPGGSKRLEVTGAGSVRAAVATLRRDPSVAYAVPNYTARACGF